MPTFNTTDPKPGYVYDTDTDTWYPLLGLASQSLDALTDVTITTPSTGQILAYNGTQWINQTETGDITAVTAGTGITGGGTSGDVTITNAMADAITTKGDLLPGTGADAFARLGVGANNTVLTADSTTATGLRWAAPASAPLVGCSLVENSVNQSVPTGTWTALTYTGELWDTDSFHSNTVNTSRITIPTGKGGKYLVSALIQIATMSSTGLPKMKLYRNGSDFKWMAQVIGGENPVLNSAIQVELNAGDFIELFVYHDAGSNRDVYKSNNYPGFSVYYLGA